MAQYAPSNTTALDAASFLVEVAAKDDAFLKPMQLQKLLYLAQCWCLAEYDRKLFDDTIEAWTKGPVVRSVWKAHSGSRNIVMDEVFYENLDEQQKAIIEDVWLAYHEYSGFTLSNMTHQDGSPWNQARGNMPDNLRSATPISLEAMRNAATKSLGAETEWLSENWEHVKKLAESE